MAEVLLRMKKRVVTQTGKPPIGKHGASGQSRGETRVSNFRGRRFCFILLDYGPSQHLDYRRGRDRLRHRSRGFATVAGCVSGGAVPEGWNGHEHAQQRGDSFWYLLSERIAEGAALRRRQPAVLRILREAQRSIPEDGEAGRCRKRERGARARSAGAARA